MRGEGRAISAVPAPLSEGGHAGVELDDRTPRVIDEGHGTRHRRGWLVRRALLVADLLGLSLALLLAGVLSRGGGNLGGAWEGVLFLTTTVPGWVLGAKVLGLYDRDEEHASRTTTDDLAGVFQLATLGAWLFYVGAWLAGVARPDFGRLVAFWALGVVLVTASRSGARSLCRRTAAYRQNTVIVGAGEVGQLVARKLLQHREYGIDLLGFVDGDPLELGPDVRHLPVLGSAQQLPALVCLLDVERVVFAFSRDSREELLELVRQLHELGVQVDMVPRFFEVIGARMSLHTVEGLSVLGLPPARLPRSSRLLKRAMDVGVAALALVLLAPLLALTAVLVKLDSPGPAFFHQLRVGARDRTFRIVKFRTMVADADARKAEVAHLNEHAREGGDVRMFKVHDDPRITRVGRLLRRSSLDELPQLWNVLHGDMSLVGPRPLILEEDCHVASWARRRLDLKPGVTGLWQVLGRSDIPFEEMLRLDYLYVTNWSILRDLQLVLRTFPALLGRTGGAY